MDHQKVIELFSSGSEFDHHIESHCIAMILDEIFRYANSVLSVPCYEVERIVLTNMNPNDQNGCWHEMFFHFDGQIGDVLNLLSQTESSVPIDLELIQNCLKYCGYITDRLWEEMHTKTWNRISLVTRQLYAYHRWLESVLLMGQLMAKTTAENDGYLIEMLKQSIKAIDHGLIMSPDLIGQLLARTAGFLNQILVALLDQFDTTGWWKRLCLQANNHRTVTVSHPPLTAGCLLKEIGGNGVGLDMLRFEMDYFRPKKPFVYRKCIQDWPCMSSHRWTIPLLLRTMAFRYVPVELGSKYTDDDWSQKIMPVHQMMKEYFFGHPRRSSGVAYLAQYNLFDQVLELCRDFDVPRYCGVSDQLHDMSSVAEFETNAWFGPAGTVSPLHFDGKDNFLVQIIGTKYVRLYSDSVPAEQIYPNERETLLWNTSKVNVENPDLEQFPLFVDIDPSLMFECLLHEGDVLYIPKNWWHFVKATTDSFSINFWWI